MITKQGADVGQWAPYDNGWLLSTKVNRAPWEAFGAANPDPLNNQIVQLYNLKNDFRQSQDIAAQNPHRVQQMKKLFIEQPEKYQLLPLGRRGQGFASDGQRCGVLTLVEFG